MVFSEICEYAQYRSYLKLVQDFSFLVRGSQGGNYQKDIKIPTYGAEVSILDTQGV